MSLRLITGDPGARKSYFCVREIVEKELKKGRPVFTDINGLNIEGVGVAEEDWRKHPDGSLVIYDEAQRQSRYKKGYSNPNDDILNDLQIHRHNGFDIWFITQSPLFLNQWVTELCDEHFHLIRPVKSKVTNVRVWQRVEKMPKSEAAKERAIRSFTFKENPKYFPLYKSASEHNMKTTIPTAWFGYGAAVLAGIFAISYLVFFNDTNKNFVTGKPHDYKEVEQQQAAADPLEIKIKECIKQFQWTEDQCRSHFDKNFQDAKNNKLAQATNNNIETVVATYKANNPFDYSYDVAPVPTVHRIFSGCILSSSGKYHALDQQGTIIHDIDSSVCKRVMNGDRPFNPYKQPQPMHVQNYDQTTNQEQTKTQNQTNAELFANLDQAKI